MREPRVELLFRIASTAFAARNFKPDGVHNLNMGIRFDNEVMRFFHPGRGTPNGTRGSSTCPATWARTACGGCARALAFVRSADPYDQAAVKAFTVELARGVARSDLAFVGRVKTLRREMEARIDASGGPRARRRPAAQMPPWAAESGRLGSSIGLELSTEHLPAPER